MRQYKGMYIDGIYFNSEKEIDEHRKNREIERYKALIELYCIEGKRSEMALACSEQEERLNTVFGMSWDEIEQIEFETMATA